ncbi:hypothetical protein HFU84_08365 [Acidithiobacillus sp. CV18-2]|uniref:DUF4760 domain-containing protein n=1 Tax=Igneacidithiobacillus copahuensis TaxID=2724909 RepID=A0AAE2YPH9_9PROT|nr:hypothetical protein [Igneacidithiobacillus copahuensis]MBU2755688.1 hypothetical protein [Acidithiobacillus sp. CV18-3]MBU2758258.1 hypothetical protein [Acidithiobacillus sp. BN09-2]MBU2777516.1 hypothetical protein [Acidithiobacillus sp. CV18-2]MBU2796830.1 hypothetical protein [Acidithiobacillus sp. VAN18-2]MBU2800440.1 hypothetical protein [Acidithiobacillus sp. VAN18-4]UTV80215.1 hypothetical protein MQE22_09295 [Acidithiobacillus sp. YTS05]
MQLLETLGLIISPTVTVIAAYVSYKSVRESSDNANKTKVQVEILSGKISELSYQRRISYERKINVIYETNKLVGKIGYYIERSIVSYTSYDLLKYNALDRAERCFENLMKYRYENNMAIWDGKDFEGIFGEIMIIINLLRAENDIDKRQQIVINNFYGTFNKFREEIKKEIINLSKEEASFIDGI